MKKFKVVFTENKRYYPATRTIEVQTMSAPQALFLTQRHFGKKRINIISVIDENGVDFLRPVLPEENDQKNDIVSISADVNDVKITLMPDTNVSTENNTTSTNATDITEISADNTPLDIYTSGYSQIVV